MQVLDLFHTVPQPAPGMAPNATSIQQVVTTQGRQCLFPFSYLGTNTDSCIRSQNGDGAL